MKICVLIPTYNEAKTIGDLVEEIHKQKLETVVIDDGSVDNTADLAQCKGSIVLVNKENQGKGASLIKGFRYALEKDFDAVIVMDGDGQHEPSDIPFFIRLAKYSSNGILIGNRMSKTKNMPIVRFLTNKIMSWFISIMAKQYIPDSQCGFRLIKRPILEKLNLHTHRYETESEILIKSSRLGFKIESVPIKTIYNGENSQINPFLDTIRFFRLIFREIWITKP